jgi:hypothetical protein
MLPQGILAVRDVGDTQPHYWGASTADGIKLLLEPGETLLEVRYCRVSQISPKAWVLPNPTTLVVTDRRTAFLTTQFDKGGGWIGFGVAGLAIATTANAVSKRRAVQRSAGKVAIGLARHEWLTGITLRRTKALIGVVDIYIDLTVATAAGARVIELWGLKVITEDFARWLVGVVSGHRMALLTPESASEKATLQRYQQGGQDSAHTGKQTDFGWFFPGKTDELIAAVIGSQAKAPDVPEQAPSS